MVSNAFLWLLLHVTATLMLQLSQIRQTHPLHMLSTAQNTFPVLLLGIYSSSSPKTQPQGPLLLEVLLLP